MATLEEILNEITRQPINDQERMTIGGSGYYANQEGNIDGGYNADYTQALEYQDMVRNMNQPKDVLYFNDRPLDNPFNAYGGRIATGIPMTMNDAERNRLILGISGQGFNAPNYEEKFRPTGVDATYQSGNTGYGVSYEQLSPEQKQLLFSIFKTF